MIEFMFYQLFIISLCSGTSGNYNQACNKTVEATSITVGVNQFENQITQYGNEKGQRIFGKEAWNTTGFIGGITYQSVVKKSVAYKIKTKKEFIGADFVKPQLDYKDGQRGASMSLGWSW